MSRHIFLTLAASVLVSIPLSVSATNPDEHFWNDSQGRVVRDGQGNCVRTMFWNAATTRSECGGKMAEAPKPAPVAPPPAPAPVTPAPAPAPVAPAPAPAPVKAPPKPITLRGDTSFRTGSSVLSSEARTAVTEVSGQIKQMEKVTAITVSGHTDSSGSDAANQKLSEARANAVRNALIEDGIDGSLVSATGYGESRPIADNTTAAGRATNRRVEIQIDGY